MPPPNVGKERTSRLQANYQLKAILKKKPAIYCCGKGRAFNLITVEDEFENEPVIYLNTLLLLREKLLE